MGDYYDKLKRDGEFRRKKEQERADMKTKRQFKYYAGVGSRETPEDILVLMEQLANVFREEGLILRTGHAPGADQAFERGAGSQAQIYLPWATFEQDTHFCASSDPMSGEVTHPIIKNDPTIEAADIAASLHSAWNYLKPGARKLHARNVHQILGYDVQNPVPVEFVVCWTPGAEVKGGTATAIRLAEEHEIPIWNLADEDIYDMAFMYAWGED